MYWILVVYVRSVRHSRNGVSTTALELAQADILLDVVTVSTPTRRPIERVGQEKCEIETTRVSRKTRSEKNTERKILSLIDSMLKLTRKNSEKSNDSGTKKIGN